MTNEGAILPLHFCTVSNGYIPGNADTAFVFNVRSLVKIYFDTSTTQEKRLPLVASRLQSIVGLPLQKASKSG
jgi:hypothetical protein